MAQIREEKLNQVRNLYYEKKLSMREIADSLEVSLGAVIYFMRKHGLTRRSAQEANRVHFESNPLSFTVKKNLTRDEEVLKASGVLLYWAEGSKWDGEQIVDFANSDPAMIRIFIRFLREICEVDEERLRGYLYCYSNQNVNELITFWSSLTRIPKNQFTKPYVRDDYKKDKIGRMEYGLLHIRYADKKLLQILKEWIDEYAEQLGK